ncbi:hypothetical protein RJ639_032241, partial [Escallonia herrerae]
MRLRAQGSSLAVSVNRLVSGVVAMTFLSISKKISFGGTISFCPAQVPSISSTLLSASSFATDSLYLLSISSLTARPPPSPPPVAALYRQGTVFTAGCRYAKMLPALEKAISATWAPHLVAGQLAGVLVQALSLFRE